MTNPQAISRFYLTLVPFVAAVVALAIGHSNPQLYLPIWLLHALLMAVAVWRLGKNCLTSLDPEQRQLGTIALLVIVPWIGFTVFAGMGPPPHDYTGMGSHRYRATDPLRPVNRGRTFDYRWFGPTS